MSLEVAVVTRAFTADFQNVTCFALVTLDGKPVAGLKPKNFTLYSPAADTEPRDPTLFGQPFLLGQVSEQDFNGKTTPHGLPGVYNLNVGTDNRNATGQFAFAAGWYVGIVTVTHTVDTIIGVGPGHPGRPVVLETEPTTYQAKTMFSFIVPVM